MLHIRLDANFQDDEHILNLTADAELLYIRSLALCGKNARSNGHIHPGQVDALTSKLRDADSAVQELIQTDLWIPTVTGWRIPAWDAGIVIGYASIAEYERNRVTPAIRATVFNDDGWQCRNCGSDGPLEVDHYVPIALGGTSALSNLWTLCTACNRRKGRLHPNVWEGVRR